MLRRWSKANRRLFLTATAGISLTAVLWVGSYWEIGALTRLGYAGVSFGRLVLIMQPVGATHPRCIVLAGLLLVYSPQPTFRNEWAFETFAGALLLPLYVPLILCILLLVFAWQRNRHRRCLDEKYPCACCGYDLRASPVRCPECGTPVENPTRRVPPPFC